MSDNIIPLIWSQDSNEAVLICKGCGDACIYKFPVDFPINKIPCDFCGDKRLTSKIPRAKQSWET